MKRQTISERRGWRSSCGAVPELRCNRAAKGQRRHRPAPKRLVIFYTQQRAASLVPKLVARRSRTERSTPAAWPGRRSAGLSTVRVEAALPARARDVPASGKVTVNGVTYFDPHDQGMGSKLTGAPIDPAGSHWALGPLARPRRGRAGQPGRRRPRRSCSRSATRSPTSRASSRTRRRRRRISPETKPQERLQQADRAVHRRHRQPTAADYRVTQGNSILDLVRGDLDALKRSEHEPADQQRLDRLARRCFANIEVGMPSVSAACNATNATSARDHRCGRHSGDGSGRGRHRDGVHHGRRHDDQAHRADDDVRRQPRDHPAVAGLRDVQLGTASPTSTTTTGCRTATAAPRSAATCVTGVDRHASTRSTRWYAGRYAKLVHLIDSINEGEGTTMLDNSMVMWLPELADGNAHNNNNLPIVIAGSAGGYLKQGQADQPRHGHDGWRARRRLRQRRCSAEQALRHAPERSRREGSADEHAVHDVRHHGQQHRRHHHQPG